MEICTIADRPELRRAMFDMDEVWPQFMQNDPIANAFYARISRDFPAYVLVATEGDHVIARAHSIPYDDRSEGRETYPSGGWDRVLVWAFERDSEPGPDDTVSAIDISIGPAHLGKGLSATLLDAMKDNARRLGHRVLVAPVRPNQKHREPHTPMEDYVRRTRDDGLPHDAWLRVHVRAGGRIEKVAPTSMTITGSLAEWRKWTGLPFDATGPVEVEGALSPVHCDVERDFAVYVEPNVWVTHNL